MTPQNPTIPQLLNNEEEEEEEEEEEMSESNNFLDFSHHCSVVPLVYLIS